MSAKIKIGAVIGSQALASTFLGVTQTLSNFDDIGVLGWKWQWLDTPSISPTLDPPPVPSFGSTLDVTPDVAGWSIRIRLTTFSDAARTIVDDVDEVVLGVRFAPPPNDFLIPCAGETSELDALKGWSREVNRILARALAGGGGGGGGGPVRDPMFWAASSNDDGTPNGSPDIVSSDTSFVSSISRINLYTGSCTTDLPAVGPGDTNKVVTYRELGGGPGANLVVTAQGTTTISAGIAVGVPSLTLYGSGTVSKFRYDETTDKWLMETGGAVLSPEQVRSRVDELAIASIDLSAATTSDADASNLATAWLVSLTASFGAGAQLGGLAIAPSINFSPRKFLFNADVVPIEILFNDGGSTHPFLPQNLENVGTFTVVPGTGIWVQAAGGSWVLLVAGVDPAVFEELLTASFAEVAAVAATKVPLDGSDAMTGPLSMGGNQITSVLDPSVGSDAATKDYVDSIATSEARTRKVFHSTLATPLTSSTLVSGVAYWQYIGFFEIARTITSLRYYISVAGTGLSVGELAIASAPDAPNGSAQVLTKIFAAAIAANLASASAIQAQAVSALIAAGTHVYAGIRTALATTQPQFNCLIGDFGDGRILSTAAAGALTGAGPWTGALVVGSPGSQCPKIVAIAS